MWKTYENTDQLQCMLKLYYLNEINMHSLRRNNIIKLWHTTNIRIQRQKKDPFFWLTILIHIIQNRWESTIRTNLRSSFPYSNILR